MAFSEYRCGLHVRLFCLTDVDHSYAFDLTQEMVVDATKHGNHLRYINHSETPNCYVCAMFVGSRVRLGVYTDRDEFIAAGQELFYDYGEFFRKMWPKCPGKNKVLQK